MTLLQKTKEIVSNSIKSAIFIDEKALENYTTKSSELINEEELSINLNSNFKKKGINLSIHKFKPTDLEDIDVLNYLFNRRDLVLLDWKLDGENGEDFSLNLLSKVVKLKHIHFCSIYTSEHNYEEIINNICTYFSGYSLEYYNLIIESIEPFIDGNNELFDSISFDKVEENSRKYNAFREIDQNLPQQIKNVTKLTNFGEALIQVKYAFLNYHKSPNENPTISHLNRTNNSLNINNTIITIIPKSENNAIKILSKLYNQIHKSDNCFTQLLGLDMQNSFSENSSFVDENLLNTKIDTLMFHRSQLKKMNLELEFNNLIKTLLMNHSQQTLENSELKILDETFLNRISKSKYSIDVKEIALLNTFYNGSKLNDKTKLNFGDVFKRVGSNDFYLCITAFCDCLYPENIKNKFFFVKGKPADDLSEVIKTGDDGFKSYLNKETCILWTLGDYVKPFQLFIPDINLENSKIIAKTITENGLVELELEYFFSLKSSYAQRIANHAFSHPLRVGVDFVKIKK